MNLFERTLDKIIKHVKGKTCIPGQNSPNLIRNGMPDEVKTAAKYTLDT